MNCGEDISRCDRCNLFLNKNEQTYCDDENLEHICSSCHDDIKGNK